MVQLLLFHGNLRETKRINSRNNTSSITPATIFPCTRRNIMLSSRNMHPSPGIGKLSNRGPKIGKKGQEFIGGYFSFLFLFGRAGRRKGALCHGLYVGLEEPIANWARLTKHATLVQTPVRRCVGERYSRILS